MILFPSFSRRILCSGVVFALALALTGCGDDSALTDAVPTEESSPATTSSFSILLNQDWVDSRSGANCYYRLQVDADFNLDLFSGYVEERTNSSTCDATYVGIRMDYRTTSGFMSFASDYEPAWLNASILPTTLTNLDYVQFMGIASPTYTPPGYYNWGGFWKIRIYSSGYWVKQYCQNQNSVPVNCQTLSSGTA